MIQVPGLIPIESLGSEAPTVLNEKEELPPEVLAVKDQVDVTKLQELLDQTKKKVFGGDIDRAELKTMIGQLFDEKVKELLERMYEEQVKTNRLLEDWHTTLKSILAMPAGTALKAPKARKKKGEADSEVAKDKTATEVGLDPVTFIGGLISNAGGSKSLTSLIDEAKSHGFLTVDEGDKDYEVKNAFVAFLTSAGFKIVNGDYDSEVTL